MDIGISIGFKDANNSNTVDLFVQIGQSNADGRGNVSALPSAITSFYATKQEDLWMFQKTAARSSSKVPISYFTDDGEWWNLAPRYDATSEETSMTILSTAEPATDNASDTTHGIEVSYGYAWAQANPGRELRMLKIAIGGATIDGSWEIETDAGDDDGIWHFFENYIWTPALADIEAEGKQLGNVYFYWMQGESDTGGGSSAYQGHLETLVTKINNLAGYDGTKNIIIGQLADIGWVNAGGTEAGWNEVKAAQATVAAANSNVELFVTDGTGDYDKDVLGGDNLHWDSPALVIQGYRLYAFSAPTAPVAVSDLTVDTNTTSADITFTRAFGARSYKIEYKQSSSSAWTTDATVYEAQTDYSITGLTTDTSYDFRVVAVNNRGETNSSIVTAIVEAPPETPLTNANIVTDLTAVYTSSYGGTGQTWTNIATGTSEPDYWLGADGSTDATDPVFTGTAGDSGAYFALNDANATRFTAKSQTTLTQNLHRSDQAQAWTIMIHFYYDATTNRYICGTSDVGTTAGIILQVATSGDNLRLRLYNSSGALLTTVQTTAALTDNADNVVGIAFDHSDGSWTSFVNGTTETGTIGSYTNTATNQLPMTIGSDAGGGLGLDEGCFIYDFAIADAKLSAGEMTTVSSEMTARRA